jgi:hypothetical protein
MDTVTCAAILTFSSVLIATGPLHAETGSERRAESRVPSTPRLDSNRIVTAQVGDTSTLRVHHVRLERPPATVPKPSVVLKFDLVNGGLTTVRDVVLEVAIVEQSSTDAAAARRVVAGPFTIRGDVDLQAGYTLNYEMLLRNLPPDCRCVANVAIVAGGAAVASGATTTR